MFNQDGTPKFTPGNYFKSIHLDPMVRMLEDRCFHRSQA